VAYDCAFILNITGWPASISASSNIVSVTNDILNNLFNITNATITVTPLDSSLIRIDIIDGKVATLTILMYVMKTLNQQLAQGHP